MRQLLTTTISKEDADNICEKIKYISKGKNIFILSIYLNPVMVSNLLEKHPTLGFYSVYHSEEITPNFRGRLKNGSSKESTYKTENFMGFKNMCSIFKKLLMNYYDEN